jgi:hypothetical protein
MTFHKFLRIVGLALLFAAGQLSATPTRVMVLDNSNGLVPDDTDATRFYHIAPNYKDHVYLNLSNSGTAVGWAFLDIKYGTLILWWNKGTAGQNLFDALGQNNSLGYQELDLMSNTGNAHAPLEGWVKAPDAKISAGWAYNATDALNLALCVQWSELDQHRDAPTIAGMPRSMTRYLSTSYSNDLTVTSYANTQNSGGMVLAPSFGYSGKSFSLDAKYHLEWNNINNSHTENVRDGGGTMSGTVTQGLKDKGVLSSGPMARLRIPMGEGSVVLRGLLLNQNLSTQHTQKGVFSGSGFLNPDELAGFDHVDAEENLSIQTWEGILGFVEPFNESKAMLVVGVGANGINSDQEDILYTPRTGGLSIKYNDLVRQTRSDLSSESLDVPFLIGAEAEISRWAKARGVLSRNVWSKTQAQVVNESFNTSNGNMASQAINQTTSENNNWVFGAGLGLSAGSLSWDMAVNTSFLGSSGTLANPILQSTLTWGWE